MADEQEVERWIDMGLNSNPYEQSQIRELSALPRFDSG